MNKRNFRPMRFVRAILLVLFAMPCVMIRAETPFAEDETQRLSGPLRICLLSGSEEYRSDETLAEFCIYLEANYPVSCTLLKAEGTEKLAGLEALDTCDLAVFFTRRLTLPAADIARIQAYCASGKPVIGVRTASHGFQNWLAMDAKIFGGNYKGHYGKNRGIKAVMTKDGKDHPIFKGVGPIATQASLYKTEPLAADCVRLLTGTADDADHAVHAMAWVRTLPKNQRVFYTSLGAPEDFADKAFRQMLVNAIFWSSNRPAPSVITK